MSASVAIRRFGAAVLALAVGGCGAWHGALRPLAWDEVSPACGPIAGMPAGLGVEDLAPDPAGGAVYASVADWAGLATGVPRPGGVYRLKSDGRGGVVAEDVTPDLPLGFFPHGLDVWRPSGGEGGRLFVVNHPGAGQASRIEIFDLRGDGALVWSPDSGAHSAVLERPNDVVGAGPRAYYASNDLASARKSWFSPSLGELAEHVFGPRSGRVVHVDLDGEASERSRAAFPNGVERSSDGRVLYVSESARGAVRVYAADGEGALRLQGALAAPRLPDNLYLEDDRWLWAAGHRSSWLFATHAKSWAGDGGHPPSPARVLRFDLTRPGASPEVLYATTREGIRNGRGLSAVSTAAPLADGFLIGSIFEGLRYCRGDQGA